MTLPSDLRHFRSPSWWSTLHDEEQSRVAGALSVTAIVMLLVTSFTLARGVQWTTGEGTPRVLSGQVETPRALNLPSSTINAAGRESNRSQRVVTTAVQVPNDAGKRESARPAPAAPFDCPRLQGRQWLRVAIWQQGDRTLAGWECVYGYASNVRFVQ